MKRTALVFLACCMISPVAFGQDKGNAEAGKKLAYKWGCTLCHGPDGNGNKAGKAHKFGDVPRISAQPQPYFIKSMHDYKNGRRSNADHEVIAPQLTEADLRDLAAWYGSQVPKADATYEYRVD
jgi:cytochrome c553